MTGLSIRKTSWTKFLQDRYQAQKYKNYEYDTQGLV